MSGKISDMTVATPAQTTDLVEIMRPGTPNLTRSVSLADVAALGGGVGGSIQTAIAALSTLQNWWKLDDTVGSATAADSKGTSPLTVSGNVAFGARSITGDGKTSAYFPGATASDCMTIPGGVLPTTGSYTYGVVVWTGGNFSRYGQNGTFDWNASYASQLYANGGYWAYNINGSAYGGGEFPFSVMRPILVILVADIVTNTSYMVIHGIPSYSVNVGIGRQSAPSSLGLYAGGGPFWGFMSNAFICTSALTPAEIESLIVTLPA